MMSEETLNEVRRVLQEPMTDGGQESPDWESFSAGIQYEVDVTVIEDVSVSGLPKHTDGSNVALRSNIKDRLSWTEDLESNIINLDGYLHDHWSEGSSREWETEDGRTLVPDWDRVELSLQIPLDELLKAAKQRASEDSSHFAYVMGNWAYLAEKADHVSDTSARALRGQFREVMESPEYETPDDATCEEHYGGGGRP
jgi:hypothetical protein